MISELLYFTGIGLILYALYKWVTLNDKYFEKKGIVHMKPLFFFGNTGGFFLKQYSGPDFVNKLYNEFPKDK